MPPTRELELVVHEDGTFSFIHDDDLAAMVADEDTTMKTVRASNVEPTGDNRWLADLAPVGGPVLGPFDRREDAISAEIAWLKEFHLYCERCGDGRPPGVDDGPPDGD